MLTAAFALLTVLCDPAIAARPAAVHPQASATVNEILAKADAAYQDKRYAESLALYRQAFKDGESRGTMFYNAACSAARSGDSGTALDLLDQAVDHSYVDFNHLATDSDLVALHENARWKPLVEKSEATLYKLLPPGVALERRAGDAAKEKRYREAGDLYVQASDLTGLYPDDSYRAAVQYTLAGDRDRAFASLDRTAASFPYVAHFETVKELEPLHGDARWQGIVERMRRAREKDLTPEQKIYGLSSFWQEAKDHFVYFDKVPNLDWDKAYREFIPLVLATHSRYDYARQLQRFAALLHDGHTNVFLPNDIEQGPLPVRLLEVNGRPYVTNVTADLAKDIPVGSEVAEIEGKPAGAYQKEQILPFISSSTDYILRDWAAWMIASGIPGQSIRFAFRRPDGGLVRKTLSYAPGNSRFTFPKRNDGYFVPGGPLVEYRDMGEGIAYVAINSFNDPNVVADFEALLPKLKDCKGLMIDIRKNGGGDTTNAWPIAAHMTDKPMLSTAWRTRVTKSAYVAWGRFGAEGAEGASDFLPDFCGKSWFGEKPETVQPSSGVRLLMPTVILTDHGTASSSEDFLVYLDKAPQITRVGRRTFGSTGQPLYFNLVGNIAARVCTKRDTYPDGRDFVGVGVIPHVEVEPTIDDLLADRDVMLAKGIEVLKVKLAGSTGFQPHVHSRLER